MKAKFRLSISPENVSPNIITINNSTFPWCDVMLSTWELSLTKDYHGKNIFVPSEKIGGASVVFKPLLKALPLQCVINFLFI